MAGRTADMLERGNDRILSRWLRGATAYLKRNREGRFPPSRKAMEPETMRTLGRERVRFPASGLRPQSYDRMLHAYARRASPSRFRVVAANRFFRIRPSKISERKHKIIERESRRKLRRSITLARKLNRASYLSPA